MKFSDMLMEKYEKCNADTKLLFKALVGESSKYCTNACSVNMKEFHYRLQKPYIGRGRKYQNYCLFTLTPSKNGVTVHLRTDGMTIGSAILKLDYIRDSSYLKGREWIKFSISSPSEISEAIRLISYIFNYPS